SKMEDVGREGRTVLIVSHNMPTIVNLCQRAVLLNAGRITQIGPAAEVVQSYMKSFYSAGGEVIWSDPARAPGNDLGRLHAIRILQDGKTTADVDIAKDIAVEISYWCMTEGTPLYPAVHLKDGMGTFVLATHNAPSVSLTDDPWFHKPHSR